MTHGTAFAILPELSAAWDAPGEANGFKVVIDVDKEAFALHSTLAGPEFAQMKASLSQTEACYVLWRGDGAAGGWALCSWIPDSCPIKHKMLYASSRAGLKKQLGKDAFGYECDWKDTDDVTPPDAEASRSDESRRAEQEKLMTDVERLRLQADALQAVEAQGAKMSAAAGLSFPLTSEASTALESFKEGKLAAVVLAIEKETVALRSQAAAATPVELRALLPPADACYCLYRWAHEREGASASATLFLYMCAEEAPVRTKMLHASTKGPFITSLAAQGLEVTKSIEGVDTDELTDAELESQLYAPAEGAAAAPTITKAAPRGGRRLVKRKE